MSKLIKLLSSRLSIVLFLLAIQIFFIGIVLQEASEYFLLLNIFFILISLIYGIKLLTKKVSATIKLPIILLLMFFPFLGVFLYYFSFENKMRKKLIKNSKNQTFTLESLYIEDSNIRKELLASDKAIYNQSQFIANNTFLPAYNNTFSKYFESGESFFNSLLDDLKSAKDFIFLEFFIISIGALWGSVLDILKQKVKEGVEVRIIFDDVGSYKTLPYKYNKTLESFRN